MEAPGREKDAARPPWAPSKSTGRLGGGVVRPPSARGNGVAARSSNLRAVRKRPLVARLTKDILQTFKKCNPEFIYSDLLNPKRFLTNPAIAVHNDGLDNANSDLILYVNLESAPATFIRPHPTSIQRPAALQPSSPSTALQLPQLLSLQRSTVAARYCIQRPAVACLARRMDRGSSPEAPPRRHIATATWIDG